MITDTIQYSEIARRSPPALAMLLFIYRVT